ncbi:endonuclease/exonuclease/phosphatase family protein [Limimaricola sp. G21655-S1]|uniref:endonuclease/exonuclease/phosphatase family protein n=1 Tax=Limimaricola sp. G21655-S1 TaxID=3014768 RepID=UPI0022AF02CD|nr:endonuclease/exonuclease/phosphatase family protein [Limimaricola sp. G21655-S1]MCZ4262405.1 endonuclease/exonuclease/phosphatase family protein [Limimaricola sp. G21655-S1]
MRRALAIAAGVLLALLCAASLLPLAETDAWWVRYLDFPRLQIAVLLVIFWIAMVALGGIGHGAARWLTVLAIAALAYHGWRLWPYQPLAAKMDPGLASCAPEERLSVLVANVQRKNHQSEEVIALAREQNPDLFFVLETDGWWDEALTPLDANYAHHVQDIPREATYYGMHVFSRHPFDSAEMRFPYGADTPLFDGVLAHPAGKLRVFGVHPRPPQMGQPSTLRDATMLEAAMGARDDIHPALLAGDFNATPWERTSRRSLRLGRLIDPRAGRGPMVSFDANSWWMKWPLDQILWQQGLAMSRFEVLPGIGSDHYPVLAELCFTVNADQRILTVNDRDLEEARTTFDKARALSDAAMDG